MNLIDLVKQFKKGIIVALSLVVIENIAWIVEPTLFGWVIDAVIDRAFVDPATAVIPPLMLWIAAFGVNSGTGVIRRWLDTKIYLKIFTSIATDVSKRAIKLKMPSSKTAARAELSYQYISFLQYRFPETIEHFIVIIGAVGAMYLFDWRIALTCLIIIFPLYVISKIYNKRVSKHQKTYHDMYEDIFDVFAKNDPDYVKEYYDNLAKPQVKISKWSAINFGGIRVTLLIIFLVVLYIAIDLDDFSAGELYSIVAYLWAFITSTEYLPELMESWTSLKDIQKRLKEEPL